MALTISNIQLMQAIVRNNRKDIILCAKNSLKEDKTLKNERQVKYLLEKMEEAEENITEIPINLKGMVTSESPEKDFIEDRYYSTKKDQAVINEILKMHKVGKMLDDMKISYKNTTLLYGPSGTGKTTFGKYIAYKLGMPFIYLNFSNVIDSYIGKTSKNISEIFSFVKSIDCVFMIDEIDCISIKRSRADSSAGEEMARVTVGVMQELDKLGNNHIILAATNRIDRLDEAILRRFSRKYFMDMPSDEDKINMVKKYIESLDKASDIFNEDFNIEELSNRVVNKSKSQADVVNNIVEYIAESIMKHMPNVVCS